MKRAEEGGCGVGWSNRASEGSKGVSECRIEQGGQGNIKGGTLRRTLLKILVLQMKNSELVYQLYNFFIVMRRNVLFDRWMA